MRILKKGSSEVRVQTENGVVLTCQAVKQLPVQHLLVKLGVTEDISDKTPEQVQEQISQRSVADQVDTAKTAMALFNYTMGYGVRADPPDGALDELKELGLSPNTKPAQRATWLNYLVLAGGQEAGTLAAVIMALTFNRVGQDGDKGTE